MRWIPYDHDRVIRDTPCRIPYDGLFFCNLIIFWEVNIKNRKYLRFGVRFKEYAFEVHKF